MAQENETGSGTQSSDSNPINRKGANTGENAATSKGTVDDIDSPGDSDPDDYMDMAKGVGKESAQKMLIQTNSPLFSSFSVSGV